MDELQNLRHHKLGSSGFRADTGPFIGSSHKIKLEEIEQDPLANFAYALMAPGTKRHYTAKLKVFFDHAGLEGSFEKQARDFVRRAMQDNAWALSSLMKFLVFQKERQARGEITAGTVANYFKPVKLFCEMNDIVLRWKKIRVGLPRAMQASSDRAPTVDELRKICNYPDRRMRAIVCLMTSSGIRLGAWDYIRWGHIKPVVSNGQVVAARLVVYPQTPDEYTTFLTPEAYDAVKSWIDYRAEKGERITDDTWVMRDLWECENPRRGTATYPEKLECNGIKRLVERALWAQGVRKKLERGKKRHEFKADHGFRKFFKTKAEQAMKPINVEFLMGHSTGVSDSYYRPTDQEILADYLKAVPSLQISEVAQAREEFAEAERGWKDRFEEMKGIVEKMQTQVNSLTGAIVAAKLSASQG